MCVTHECFHSIFDLLPEEKPFKLPIHVGFKPGTYKLDLSRAMTIPCLPLMLGSRGGAILNGRVLGGTLRLSLARLVSPSAGL